MKSNHNPLLSSSLPNVSTYNLVNITNINNSSNSNITTSNNTMINNHNSNNINTKQLFDFNSNKENNINQLNINPQPFNTKVKLNLVTHPNTTQHISPNSSSNTLIPSYNQTNFIPISLTSEQPHSKNKGNSSPGTPTQFGSPMSTNVNIFNPFDTNNIETTDSSDLDQHKPPKKFRNSQSLFYNNFHHLSLASSDKNSPLSRSTSDLSHSLDIHDSDEIYTLTRSQTCFENMNSFTQKPQHTVINNQLSPSQQAQRDSPSRLLRKIDFNNQSHSLSPSPMQSTFLLPLSSSAPSFLTPLTLSTSPPTAEQLLLQQQQTTRPNTPTQFTIRTSADSSSYPSSPPPTPIQSHHCDDGEMEIGSPIAPTPVKDTSSTCMANVSMEDGDNTSPNTSIDILGSPYKTPSKSSSAGCVSNNQFTSNSSSLFAKSPINNPIFKPFLSHSSDNMKKRSRTCLDLSTLVDKDYDIIEEPENNNQPPTPPTPPQTTRQPIHPTQQQQNLTNIIIGINKNKHYESQQTVNRQFTMPPLLITSQLNNISPDSSAMKNGSLTSRPIPLPYLDCNNNNTNSTITTSNNNNNSNVGNSNQDIHFNHLEYSLKLQTCVGRSGFNNITPDVLAQLMDSIGNSNNNNSNKTLTIIDCRYGYEFEGGHIKNAINIPPYLAFLTLKQKFFETPSNNDHTIVFHCEFSSKRAPECYNLFRWLDREHNHYPNIHYPEIYLLTGGYKNFWETFPEKCSGEYVTMNDSRFANEKRIEEEKKKQESKRSRFLKSRSHSFHV